GRPATPHQATRGAARWTRPQPPGRPARATAHPARSAGGPAAHRVGRVAPTAVAAHLATGRRHPPQRARRGTTPTRADAAANRPGPRPQTAGAWRSASLTGPG